MKKSRDVYEYNYIHQWNLRNWVKTGVCEHCKQDKITEWSSKSHDYIRQDKSDWQELCTKCHSKYDREVLGVRVGRPKLNKPKLPKRPMGRPKGTKDKVKRKYGTGVYKRK